MSEPITHHATGTSILRWEDELMQATVSRVHESSDGTLRAEVKWITWANGTNEHILTERLNLLSGQAKSRMANELSERVKICDCRQIVEDLALIILDHHRTGEPVKEICPWEKPKQPEFLIYPIWPKAHPTILFGLGGTGKSLLALTLAITAQLPWHENHLKWVPAPESTRVLYLDWESDPDELHWRLCCLYKGNDLENSQMPIGYRRCYMPLADDIDRIEEAVAEGDYGAVIIDSVGPACGGNLNDPESALRLFGAIRRLHVSSLLLAHTAKNNTNGSNERKATPFGSAFFINLARSVWEVQLIREAGEQEITVGLHHRKTNISKLQKTRALNIYFDSDAISLTRVDPDDIPGLAAVQSKQQQIINLLKHGAMTVEQISLALDCNENSVRGSLHKMKGKGQVVIVGESGKKALWGLKASGLVGVRN